jgi:hypothetical protein
MELAENFHPHADGRDKASFNPPSFPYHPHSTFRIKTQGGANLIPYLYFVTSQITEFLPSFLSSLKRIQIEHAVCNIDQLFI